MSLTPFIWCMNFSVWASREASWKWKAIKHTGWTASLYWALLKCNSSRRRRERPKDQSYSPPMSSLLHSEKETTLVAEQIQSRERNGLLGAGTLTVSWVERKLENKRKTKKRKHRGQQMEFGSIYSICFGTEPNFPMRIEGDSLPGAPSQVQNKGFC